MARSDDLIRANTALCRFGVGARPGDLERIASDPLGALREEIAARAVARPEAPDLLTTREALGELDEFRTARKIAQRKEAEARLAAQSAEQEAATKEKESASGGSDKMASAAPPWTAPSPSGAPPAPKKPSEVPPPQRIFRAEAVARFQAVSEAKIGFGERLVWFWANHFAVSVAKGGPIRVTAGSFEREAIRPHVFGRFADMLIAVEKHPTMLIYLDNRQSIGPNSKAGERRGRGLNENLGRETLELHTLGVDGGYTQTDVTNLAKVITGWTVIGPYDEDGDLGAFLFNRNRHEPGPQTVLGKTYPAGGVEQGEAVLRDIARHPATARHIAFKLARHFVADDPPKTLVAQLAKRFRETEGDLAAVSLALAEAKEAWDAPAKKVRAPQEFLAASLRAIGRKPEIGQLLGSLNAMGQPLWMPSGPNGFPDVGTQWASPEGMKTRLDLAAGLGRQAGNTVDPRQFLETILGPAASQETREAVARAESRFQGVAIALMSPEFQRR